jgi:L-threonylcarbamoyladenylate synthase
MDAAALQTALDLLGPDRGQGAAVHDTPLAPAIALYARTRLRCATPLVLHQRMPADAAATAQELFAVLRQLDDQGVKLIWIETPPDTPEWEGVRDRLQRAAA